MEQTISRDELHRQADWVGKNIHKAQPWHGYDKWEHYRASAKKVKLLASHPDLNFADD